MSTVREQVLSEFIDAWNAGERPDVDDYIPRVPAEEQAELADELLTFLSLAPTPEYSDEALAAIRAEPELADALSAAADRGGLLPRLLAQLRERFAMSTDDVAERLVGELGLEANRQPKTAGYLAQLEEGRLEPSRVSKRVFDALGRVFRIRSDELEAAADAFSSLAAPAAAPAFRADEGAAARASHHLDVLANALAAPGGGERDEVDELFLGGR